MCVGRMELEVITVGVRGGMYLSYLLLGTLRYWNADALKNALFEEGLDRVYGVRGGKIKLRMCCVRKRQREVSSCDSFIQRNSRSVALSHASGFITDVEFLLLHEENTSDNLMIR